MLLVQSRDFVAEKSQIVGKSIGAKVMKKLQMKDGSKESLICGAIKINKKAPLGSFELPETNYFKCG